MDAEQFGILSGFTIPVPTSFGQLTLLTLTNDSRDAPPAAVQNTTQAIAAAAFVHASILRLSSNLRCGSDIHLSGRQKACLAWASFGKTYSETAQLLGIAEGTVRFYIIQAKEKLGAKNVAHAVRLAVQRELI